MEDHYEERCDIQMQEEGAERTTLKCTASAGYKESKTRNFVFLALLVVALVATVGFPMMDNDSIVYESNGTRSFIGNPAASTAAGAAASVDDQRNQVDELRSLSLFELTNKGILKNVNPVPDVALTPAKMDESTMSTPAGNPTTHYDHLEATSKAASTINLKQTIIGSQISPSSTTSTMQPEPLQALPPVVDLSQQKQQQINNFRNGNALLLNFHITHHGGTFFCGQLGRHLKSPSFACMGGNDIPVGWDPNYRPWSHNHTADQLAYISNYYDMISWEFGAPPKFYQPQVIDTDWENPNLVSVIIMRDPISRLLAGDGIISRKYPNIANYHNASIEEWWKFAHEPTHTNNFALSILAGNDCCHGNATDPIHLELAKTLLSRFTYVLDIDCLNEGMQAMVDQLGMQNVTIRQKKQKAWNHHHPPASERIGYAEVYNYLLERNKLDIELYEWSKTISLVNCSSALG